MIEEIHRNLNLCVAEIRELVDHLNEDRMFFQPLPGMNPPGWHLGHIVFAFEAIGGEMGISPWLPRDWTNLFGQGSSLDNDPASYPDKETLLAALEDGRNRIEKRLNRMTPEELSGPLPDARFREKYPTLGHAVLYSLIGHTYDHVGQIRAWRRAALSRGSVEPIQPKDPQP